MTTVETRTRPQERRRQRATITTLRPGERVFVTLSGPCVAGDIAAWIGTVMAVDVIGVRLQTDEFVPGDKDRPPVPSKGERLLPWLRIERVGCGANGAEDDGMPIPAGEPRTGEEGVERERPPHPCPPPPRRDVHDQRKRHARGGIAQ